MNPALQKLRELVAKKHLESKIQVDSVLLGIPPEGEHLPAAQHNVLTSADKVIYNLQQAQFIQTVLEGKSCALIGPAGTGKTTSTRGAILSLIQSNKVPKLDILKHKHLSSGTPGIVCTSFTNKAVQNTKRVLPEDLRHNCLTLHKLLEYQPEYYEVWDQAASKYKKTMRFVPARNESNPLPTSIQVIIIDEASMVPTDLWNNLFRALPPNHPKLQIILILDIQQLPPVFGRSIAIHALEAGIPRIELVEVYRQALESPIISLAHRILSGQMIPKPELESWNIDKMEEGNGKLTIKPWKKALGIEASIYVMSKFLPEQIDGGHYDPTTDVILSPYNKAGTFGCVEMNKIVATHLAHNYNPDKEPVHEIIAGFNKKYFRVGDKVLWNKTEHFITKIEKNNAYFGNPFKRASLTLDYEGVEHNKEAISALSSYLSDDHDDDGFVKSIDDILGAMSGGLGDKEKEDLVRAASHRVTVYSEEFDSYETLDTAGDLNALDLGYAMTVHKSQGSEYRRVYFITHASQSNMLFRELIYTAVTRAREELFIVCPPSLFVAGITSQRLPGKSLEDKIAAFERYMKVSKVGEDEKPLGLYLLSAPQEN